MWGWNSHSQKWELGVLWDSQKFRARFQGSKHFTSGCSLYQWKGLEACPKWPCMSHLDICSQSYGQKKGWESNWQFDSRPLKVGNRSFPNVCKQSAIGHWKALEESYNFGLDLTPIGGQSQEIWMSKVPKVQTQDSFGTPPWEFREKVSFRCGSRGVTQRILYGGRWWLPSSPGCGESSESKVARGLSQHQMDAEWVLTNLGLVLDAGPNNNIIVPLPSLISGLLACPSYPL